ncbi:MAG: hypothetical protein K9G40_06395 [Crocinitomicaceae bacterium]|nr:hypothetical protein [Crocinitomicaceae bacterium]MCF8434472.1 hypothetical protein [Crocinitomicaceae bacterium]
MSENLDNMNAGEAKRPTFLTVLCILTFIGSGLGVLVFLLATVAFGVVSGMMESIPGMGALTAGGIAFFAISLILSAVSLFGAIQMWKLKKMGYYMYVGAGVVSFVLPIVMLGLPFNVMGVFWLVLFAALYGMNLKHMN